MLDQLRAAYSHGRLLLRYGLGRLTDGGEVLPEGLVSYGLPDRHVFFGYYDVTPFRADNRLILAHSVSKANSPPEPGQSADLGYFRTGEPGRFYKIAETEAWCRQQGARLQWYPRVSNDAQDQVFYNVKTGNGFGSVVQSIGSGDVEKRFSLALYDVSADGSYGLGLDFVRLGRLRPGYGYASTATPNLYAAPAESGIASLCLKSGVSRVLFSVADIAHYQPTPSMRKALHYINHISISPGGSCFIFFHFWVSPEGRRYSRILVCERESSSPRCLLETTLASHYAWMGERHILCFCAPVGQPARYRIIDLDSGLTELLDHTALRQDGHPTVSESRRWMITDTYPDRQSKQHVLRYDLKTTEPTKLASFHNPWAFRGEVRCDLHPRLSSGERLACVDSARSGLCALYTFPIN